MGQPTNGKNGYINGNIKNGLAARITLIATIVGIMSLLIGGLWDLSTAINNINTNIKDNSNKLDRNCRIAVRNSALIQFSVLGEEELTNSERNFLFGELENQC